jgi:hypothetical protein
MSPKRLTADSNTPSDSTAAGDSGASAGGRQLVALLVCFTARSAAAKAWRPLERQLRSNGNIVLDTTVLQVDQNGKASVHDPRRVLAGTLTPMVTWGVFGALTGGLASLVISAAAGALCGGVYAYHTVHHATKAQLARLGSQLPAQSSALLTFTESSDPRTLLYAAAGRTPSIASVAAIAEDLTARVFVDLADTPVDATRASADRPDATPRLSMILVRYREPGAARQIASRIAARAESSDRPEVELVVETDRAGHRRVIDPKFGSWATGKNNIVSWGGLGLVCGAIAGATGGGGIVGFLKGGVGTGIFWGLFGLAAGALYGVWAGRATTARRLKGIGPILAPGTSTLLAWAELPVSDDTTKALAAPASQRLVLSFNQHARGAVLATA